MTPRLQLLLVGVIVIEVLVGGTLVWRSLREIHPPQADLSRLDAETAEALRALQGKCRNGTSEDWRELAEGYLGNGYYSEAEQCFRRAVELNPEDLRAAYGRGFCLERIGQTSAAIPVLMGVAKVADADLAWTCWYQVGRCYLREENVSAAEAAFREIPEFSPAVYQLSKLLVRTDRVEEAVPMIENQLRQAPNEVKFLQLKGKAATALGDQHTAAEMRDREDRAEYLLETEYGLRFIGMMNAKLGLGARLSRALQMKESGSIEQQSAALFGALKLIRENQFWNYRSVLVAMAEVKLASNRLAEVHQLIDEIRKNSQDGPDLLDLEGQAFYAAGRTTEAIAVWKRSLAMKPTAELFHQLAAAENDPKLKIRYQAGELFIRGTSQFRLNRVETALPWLQEAASLRPDDQWIQFYLGEAHRVLENPQEAMSAYRKCLEINADHSRAIDRLNSVSEQ